MVHGASSCHNPDMTPNPSGRVERQDGALSLVLTRRIALPIDDVWGWVSDSSKLGQWIGTWTGNPSDGVVAWTMTAEGVEAPEPMRIRACSKPSTLHVTAESPMGHWPIDLDLVEAGGFTELSFIHHDVQADMLGAIGAGWEYYLDRLLVVLEGGEVDAIDFERDYFPAMADHFAPPAEGEPAKN